jgi:DNA-binding MarR family transcriptional regulator
MPAIEDPVTAPAPAPAEAGAPGDAAALAETTQCLCLASRRAARGITRAFDRALRAHGLRATQFTLLAVLELAGEQTVGSLAAHIDAERTTMTRNLAVAEAQGLVRIRRDEADARARRVAITPAGRDRLLAALAAWREVQARLTGTMGEAAAEGLRRLARSAGG